MVDDVERFLPALRNVLSKYDGIAFAYLFGSFAKGIAVDRSDLDIGIYFSPKNVPLDLEDDVYFESEESIWNGLEAAIDREVDLVVLNRAPATVCAAVLHDGHCLFIRNRSIFLEFLLRASTQAADFRDFEREFYEIKRRSSSLNEIDRNRLFRILDFCKDELSDLERTDRSLEQYTTDRVIRRNLERMIENIVNSGIDIAKILLAAEKRPIPQTYRETMRNLIQIEGFDESLVERLSANTRLRNILAHEYLDIRLSRIKSFLTTASVDYATLVQTVEEYLETQGTNQ